MSHVYIVQCECLAPLSLPAANTHGACTLLSPGPPYYWNWTDWSVPGINVTYYVHWGQVQPDMERGPSNSLGQCGVAKYRLAYDSPSAWGWEAEPCSAQNHLICKLLRECLQQCLAMLCSGDALRACFEHDML